jgi:hypothetical protein
MMVEERFGGGAGRRARSRAKDCGGGGGGGAAISRARYRDEEEEERGGGGGGRVALEEGEALLLVAEGVDGALARGVRGLHQLGHVCSRELAVVGQGILQDLDDRLLERDDMAL